MTHEYTTRGTCARKILFDVEDGKFVARSQSVCQ